MTRSSEPVPAGRRWPAVWALLVLVVIAYVDRVNTSVLITDRAFTDHFGLTGAPAAQGLLMTLFLLGNGVAAFALSPIYESALGVRRGLLVSIGSWTVLTLVSPLAFGAVTLLVLRFLLGGAEGPLFSLKTMYIRARFTDREVGTPNAVSSMGVSLGTAIGLPLVTYLVFHLGWGSSFVALAALNLFVGIPLILTTVGRGADSTPPAAVRRRAWSTFRVGLRTPRIGAILAVEIATLAFLWGSSSWLPSYLRNARHFSVAQTGLISALPFLASLGSGLLGGVIIDRLLPRRVPWLLVVGSIGTAVSVLTVVLAAGPVPATVGLVLANGFWGLQAPVIPTLVQHHADPGAVGSTYGVVNGVGNVVSAFMPTVMGAAIGAGGVRGYAIGYALLIATQVISLLVGLVLLVRRRSDGPTDRTSTGGAMTTTSARPVGSGPS